MRRDYIVRSIAIFVFAIVASSSSVFPCNAASQIERRPWTARDITQMRYFASDWSQPAFGGPPAQPLVSAGGTYFAVMTHRSDFACDCNRYEMSIYSSNAVKRSALEGKSEPPPIESVVMRSFTSDQFAGPAIRDVHWENDSQIIFSGSGEHGGRTGVFRLDLLSGQLRRLTDPSHEVVSYDVRGDAIVYTTWERAVRRRDENGYPEGMWKYPIQPLRGGFVYGGIWPFLWGDDKVLDIVGTYASNGRGQTWTIAPRHEARYLNIIEPRISPDGRWAVVGVLLDAQYVPEEWKKYDGLDAPYPLLSLDQQTRLQKLMLIDLKSGASRPIWDVPPGPHVPGMEGGPPSQVFWSPDSKHILVSNFAPPVLVKHGEINKQLLVDFDVQSGKATAVKAMIETDSKRPDQRNNILIMSAIPRELGGGVYARMWSEPQSGSRHMPASAPHNIQFNYAGGRWHEKPAAWPTAPEEALPALDDELALRFQQGINDPVQLLASSGKAQIVLVGPDPGLEALQWRNFQEFRWTKLDGKAQVGGLVLPRGRGPFPLVIQFETFAPAIFLPEGTFSRTAYAAQLLAAQGIAVLTQESAVTGPEMDHLIEILSSKGLVDPTKVGVMGFSGSGFTTYNFIAHTGKVVPAAALIADSLLRNYAEATIGQAMYSDGLSDYKSYPARGAETQWHGSFWDEKSRARWLNGDANFNVDKIETPALFVYSARLGGAPAMLAETVGAFRLNKREIDLMMLPTGVHQLVRPLEREASLNATLEWMAFWLQDREISPEKKDQYWYWRKLRAQRDARWAAEGHPGLAKPLEELTTKSGAVDAVQSSPSQTR